MTFLKAKLGLYGLFLFTILLGYPFYSAFAQNILKYSTTEDVAIAFYKTGDKVPNFERWIKDRKPYNLTPWARREEMLANETARLQSAYKNFNPSNDFLTIRTYVSLDPQEVVNEAGEKSHKMQIAFSEAPEAMYFPYDFMDQRIVIFPNHLERIMKADIGEGQYNLINEAIRTSVKNTMIVRLRPTESDFSKPYMIDGIAQWVMKADIVSLEIWSRQGRLLWEYTADWYVSPNTKKLNNLFADRPVGSQEKGSVKPLYPSKK